MSISHDFSAIEELERKFAQKREEEHQASIEKDLSRLRAKEKEANGRADAQIIQAQAERRKKTGYAALAAGLGIGAAAFGVSFLLKPKIIETTKIVTETKTVEVPKLVEVPKILETTKVVEVPKLVEHTKVVEVPKIIEKPMPAPQAPPAPKPGDHTTPDNFTGSEDYKNTFFKGKLISHRNGEIKFANGKVFLDMHSNGTRDQSVNNDRHNGDYAYCAQDGNRFPDGSEAYHCYALHNGVVEHLSFKSPEPMTQNNPIDLFGPSPHPKRQPATDDPLADLFDLN
jgi:Inner membrane complex protein